MFVKRFTKTAAAVLAASLVSTMLMVGCSDDSNPANNNVDDTVIDDNKDDDDDNVINDDDVVIHEVMHEFAVDFAETNIDMFMNNTPSLMRTAAIAMSDKEREAIVEYMYSVQVLTEINMLISRYIEAGFARYEDRGMGIYQIMDGNSAHMVLEFRVNGEKIEGIAHVKMVYDEGYAVNETNRIFVFNSVYSNGQLREFEMAVAQRNFVDGNPIPGLEELSYYFEVQQFANGDFTYHGTDQIDIYDDDGNYVRTEFIPNGVNYQHILWRLDRGFTNIESVCTINMIAPNVLPVTMEIMETVQEMFAEYWAWEETLYD